MKKSVFLSLVFLSFSLWGFSGKREEKHFMARADLQPKSGSAVQGSVTFEETEGGLKVNVQLRGVTSGFHGFHIHEKGDCSSPDGKSAGGHFSPASHDHAGPDSGKRHLGDMGNLKAEVNGIISESLLLTLPEGIENWDSIEGKAVILHDGQDDLKSQPSGAAGKRVACGVIVRRN